MRITQETATWLRRISQGDHCTDLGQLTPATRRTFKKMTERGQLVEAVYTFFPKHKRTWLGAALPRAEWPDHVCEAA